MDQGVFEEEKGEGSTKVPGQGLYSRFDLRNVLADTMVTDYWSQGERGRCQEAYFESS